MRYHFYLLKEDATTYSDTNRIAAAETITAIDDVQAIHIAHATYNACSDVSAKFELWRGPVCLATSSGYHRNGDGRDLEALIRTNEVAVLELAGRLAKTFRVVRENRKFLECLDRMRRQVSHR